MAIFQWVLLLLVGAVGLTALSRRINVPYPSLLALGGVALALLPTAPRFELDPTLTLALFLAPVLLDAAYDTSVRDLRANWIPITALVIAAVGITTMAVAWTAHTLVPQMPWAAAIALGAIVAPPDAAAASAILKQLRLPHRLLVILEGESLLNDASALMIYRIAVLAVASGGLELGTVLPMSVLAIVGSVVAGYVLARLYLRLAISVSDVPSSIVLQFAGTFGVWILAEHLHLSAIVTVVVYGITVARDAPRLVPARNRIPSYAVWDLVVFVLNVLAFVLIGLQLRPILGPLSPEERVAHFEIGAIVLGIVVAARFVWVFSYAAVARLAARWAAEHGWPTAKPSARGALVVSWCGMRGIVTLAAAYALPSDFPSRDLILLTAFCVVVGTLILQGLTLRPLIRLLNLHDDDPVDREVRLACERIVQVGLQVLDADQSQEAKIIRRELEAQLAEETAERKDPDELGQYDTLRARIVAAQRDALLQMRSSDEIGDDAFHRVEAQLDVAEVNALGAQYP
jgi:monovalent cation/hydrogen antiporter